VIENDGATGKIQIGFSQCNHAIGGCMNRTARWRCDIEAEVGSAGLSVQHPLAAVNAADAPACRPVETVLVICPGITPRSRAGDHRAFLPDAFQ